MMEDIDKEFTVYPDEPDTLGPDMFIQEDFFNEDIFMDTAEEDVEKGKQQNLQDNADDSL